MPDALSYKYDQSCVHHESSVSTVMAYMRLATVIYIQNVAWPTRVIVCIIQYFVCDAPSGTKNILIALESAILLLCHIMSPIQYSILYV
jgi:hypothetical protein